MGSTGNPVNAPSRLGSLIDQIVTACPDAAMLVAKIISSSDAPTQSRIVTYDAAIDGVVASRTNVGKHVAVVDMSQIISDNDRYDKIHPNDEGYRLMANAWYVAIAQANTNGWINNPVAVTSGGDSHQVCALKVTWFQDNQIADGAGFGRNKFTGSVCTSE